MSKSYSVSKTQRISDHLSVSVKTLVCGTGFGLGGIPSYPVTAPDDPRVISGSMRQLDATPVVLRKKAC